MLSSCQLEWPHIDLSRHECKAFSESVHASLEVADGAGHG